MVSYCDRWMSAVHLQQLLPMASPPKLLAGFWHKFGRNNPYMVLFKNVQMVPVHCISRSHKIKIDF